MKSTVSLQVDTDVLLQLIAQLRRLGGTQDISEAVTAAIAHWLAERAKDPAGADPASLILAALLSHAAVPAAPAKTAVEPPPAPGRDITPGPGWNLPERRQFRYRLEDVAFD